MNLEEKSKRDGRFFMFMIPAFFLWLIGQYIFPMFPTDQLNVLIPYFAENYGWTPSMITDPCSYGRIFLIPVTLVLGNIIIRLGPKRAFCIFVFFYGLCQVLVALSALNGAHWMMSAGMFMFPTLGVGTLMATFSLIKNWFRGWRGTALGVVTAASPLSSALSIQFLTAGWHGIGMMTTLLICALVVVATGLVGFLIIKETPEQVGCFPDGLRVAPPPEILLKDEYASKVRAQHVFRHKEAWCHLITFGILLSSLTVYPAFFVTRFAQLGFTDADLLHFTLAFSILGALLSLISGVIDDRFGTRVSTMGLCILFFIGTIGLRFGTPEQSWMIWIGIAALGGVIGAAPNLNPSMLLYTFGRKCFDPAFKYTYTVLNIFPAAALWVTAKLLEVTGGFNLMYSVMIGFGALVIVLILIDKKHVDLTADVVHDELKKNPELAATVSEEKNDPAALQTDETESDAVIRLDEASALEEKK
ncbi:MAG: MFS transporter [Clostridiales Family XIII bacterium]|jgi:MFS family permease|nr:MFS transporter [Clostridiales Family XIII bacterium]